MTRFSVYLKSIRTWKYALFEIKIFRNSYFASCTKISVSKITCYTVVLCCKEGLELVANVFKSFLATYLATKFTKKVVLLVHMPDTDIGITALLLKLRSSNSRHDIAVNCLTTRRVQLLLIQ